MATLGSDVPAQAVPEISDHHVRDRWIFIAEKLVDSPRLDTGIDPELTPIGKDRGMLARFMFIDLVVAGAVAGTAVLDRTWLLVPLMTVLFVTLGLFIGMMNQLLSDPVG